MNNKSKFIVVAFYAVVAAQWSVCAGWALEQRAKTNKPKQKTPTVVKAVPAVPVKDKTPGKILSLTGAVTINGKPATLGQIIPEGASIETGSGGVAVIGVGEDNVVKVSSQSVLKLETTSQGKVETMLEKGRIEGVVRVDPNATPSQVGTNSGNFEVKGGRYVVEVGDSKSSNRVVQFVAIDGNAKVSSNAMASIANTISMKAGDALSLRGANSNTEKNVPAVIVQQKTFTPNQMSQTVNFNVTPNTKKPEPIVQQSNVKTSTSLQSVSAEPVIQQVNQLNRDPLQSVGQTTVRVRFIY